MKHVITWFEIPVKNFEKARKFYETVLGIEIQAQQMGPDLMGIIQYEEGAVGGSIVSGDGYEPGKEGVKIYFDMGNDLSPALGRVESAGGKVLLPKTLITEEIGYFASFADPEGNVLYFYNNPS